MKKIENKSKMLGEIFGGFPTISEAAMKREGGGQRGVDHNMSKAKNGTKKQQQKQWARNFGGGFRQFFFFNRRGFRVLAAMGINDDVNGRRNDESGNVNEGNNDRRRHKEGVTLGQGRAKEVGDAIEEGLAWRKREGEGGREGGGGG